jgi:hypothetical protein
LDMPTRGGSCCQRSRNHGTPEYTEARPNRATICFRVFRVVRG